MYFPLLLLGIMMGYIVADNNLFVETLIEGTSNHSIISQLESVSKLQCLHKCKMMSGKCSDVVFERSEVGLCLLLKPSDGEPLAATRVEKAMDRLGMSNKNSGSASVVELPSSMYLTIQCHLKYCHTSL